MKLTICFLMFYLLQCSAKDITVVFPANLPPWVIDEENGLALDLVRNILGQSGYGFAAVFSPLPRLSWTLGQAEVDAVAMVEDQTVPQVFYSLPLGELEAVIVTLQGRNIRLTATHNLEQLAVLAFKGSTQVFPALKDVAGKNTKFQEMTDQYNQVNMLLMQRTDAIILDKHVFLYWYHQGDSELFRQQVSLTPLSQIIPASKTNPIYVVFKDEVVRNQFNASLKLMQTDGTFDAIYQRYLRR